MTPGRPHRVVVAATTPDPDLRAVRAARDRVVSGHEVVLLGDALTPAQVARSAVAEDADEVVVSADAVEDVEALLSDAGASDIEVTPLAPAEPSR